VGARELGHHGSMTVSGSSVGRVVWDGRVAAACGIEVREGKVR
jgi:hypothetical protein